MKKIIAMLCWVIVTITGLTLLFMSEPIDAAIHKEMIEYKDGDVILEGYLAYDDSIEGRRPGVLVVHEWTGIGDYVKKRVEQRAEEGYIAFAADIYGKGIRPGNKEDAAKEAQIYRADRKLMRSGAQAGLKQLKTHPLTDTARIAGIGYCFGGGVVCDPRYINFGVLRVFNDDTLSPGAVWPLHPHRDIKVVTYCASGEFRHADERGKGGILKKGWVAIAKLHGAKGFFVARDGFEYQFLILMTCIALVLTGSGKFSLFNKF